MVDELTGSHIVENDPWRFFSFSVFLITLFIVSLHSFNRDWRYHKEERVWITRAPGMEPTLKTNTYERGTYYFFDCLNWRKVAKVRVFLCCLSSCTYARVLIFFYVKIVSASRRSFIWSMKSWKNGLTCQQHSTTTQPSRPSKARPVQKATAVPAHNAVAQGGRCGSHSLVFIPRGFGFFD